MLRAAMDDGAVFRDEQDGAKILAGEIPIDYVKVVAALLDWWQPSLQPFTQSLERVARRFKFKEPATTRLQLRFDGVYCYVVWVLEGARRR